MKRLKGKQNAITLHLPYYKSNHRVISVKMNDFYDRNRRRRPFCSIAAQLTHTEFNPFLKDFRSQEKRWNELKDKKFFGGEEIGLVDIAAVFIAFWIPIFQEIAGLQLFTSEKFPILYKWSQEFLNHPFVHEVLPPRDPLFAYFKARYESLSASKQTYLRIFVEQLVSC